MGSRRRGSRDSLDQVAEDLWDQEPVGDCLFEVDPGSRYVDPQPSERCGEETLPGCDFCTNHQQYEPEPEDDRFDDHLNQEH